MKHKITDRWFVPQKLLENGDWDDIVDQDLTRKEAREHLVVSNCIGHKARIIERIAAFRVVAEKDFTDPHKLWAKFEKDINGAFEKTE